jgi:hypothetical protein
MYKIQGNDCMTERTCTLQPGMTRSCKLSLASAEIHLSDGLGREVNPPHSGALYGAHFFGRSLSSHDACWCLVPKFAPEAVKLGRPGELAGRRRCDGPCRVVTP